MVYKQNMSAKSHDKRIFRLLYALGRLNSGGPVKTSELAEEFNVSLRTVQRDLELLNMTGFPLESVSGGYRFVEGFSLQRVVVSPEEKFLLGLFYRLFSGAGMPFDAVAREFISKTLLIASESESPEPEMFTESQRRSITKEIVFLSGMLGEKMASGEYPPSFLQKAEESLSEIEDKVKKLEAREKAGLMFSRGKNTFDGTPSAVITAPDEYFGEEYLSSDFCEGKGREFNIRFYPPYGVSGKTRCVLRTSARFDPGASGTGDVSFFDGFASYLGFKAESKNIRYSVSRRGERVFALASARWEKRIPAGDSEINHSINNRLDQREAKKQEGGIRN